MTKKRDWTEPEAYQAETLSRYLVTAGRARSAPAFIQIEDVATGEAMWVTFDARAAREIGSALLNVGMSKAANETDRQA